jgi:SAM-dependent methyltransferase
MSAVDTISEFDTFAEGYDAALNQGLAISGEEKSYFAAGRMNCLGRRLAQLEFDPESVLDFGCGTGSATSFFFSMLGVKRVLGVDSSGQSLVVAERTYGSSRVTFQLASEFTGNGEFDLAFCNGVFHHIPPAERPKALQQIHAALRSGGMFAFWENNPWNPGTRYVMSRIPFDRDAVMVWPNEARKLLGEAGFEILRTDFAFIFPGFLRWLRGLERRLCRVALGAQYMVLARKR